jgi:hypothetical protein
MEIKKDKTKKQNKEVRISFRITKELYNLLKEKMSNDRLTESYVIRTALIKYLLTPEYPNTKEK